MSVETDEALDGPGAILAQLGEKLKASDGADKELAAILTAHLLVEAPAENCVADAKAAVAALAERRASPAAAEDGEPAP